jgi:ubiquinone/menaquinone biosynthesis C-methylase UbiE
MPGLSFDRAVDYYDATRGFAAGVGERIRDAILSYTGINSHSRLLDLGTGTGRVALPFVEAGYQVVGVDISLAMMRQALPKLACLPLSTTSRYQLCQADVTHLPFSSDSFDLATSVHVLHLVEGWQQAIGEVRRTLRSPGGWLVMAYDGPSLQAETASSADLSTVERTRRKWKQMLRERGIEYGTQRPGIYSSDERVKAYLREQGAIVETISLATYEYPAISPRDVLAHIRGRVYSGDWHTPEPIHTEAAQQLETWITQEFDDPHQAVPVVGEFRAVVARF